jgi:hypothetical protein
VAKLVGPTLSIWEMIGRLDLSLYVAKITGVRSFGHEVSGTDSSTPCANHCERTGNVSPVLDLPHFFQPFMGVTTLPLPEQLDSDVRY